MFPKEIGKRWSSKMVHSSSAWVLISWQRNLYFVLSRGPLLWHDIGLVKHRLYLAKASIFVSRWPNFNYADEWLFAKAAVVQSTVEKLLSKISLGGYSTNTVLTPEHLSWHWLAAYLKFEQTQNIHELTIWPDTRLYFLWKVLLLLIYFDFVLRMG
jgi:hypothetical protein